MQIWETKQIFFVLFQQIIESTVGAATEWTDKKHSLYLNSMEQSFINQLYQYHSHDSPVTARTNSSQRSSVQTRTDLLFFFKFHEGFFF